MVTVGDKAYGTNWYLLNKGENIPGFGKAQNDWLINYKTGELIKLEKNEYSNLSSSDSVIESARNNIIFNLDASSIGQAGSVKDLESDTVEFVGFDDVNENSGLTENSFKFDGVDDYVKIKYDDSPALNQDGTIYKDEDGNPMTKKQVLAENGLTFEFYGKLNAGKSYKYEDNTLSEYEYDTKGIFGYWNGNELEQCSLRFCITHGDVFLWNFGGVGKIKDKSDFPNASNGSAHNQRFDTIDLYDNKEHYFAITLDTNTIFREENGEKYYSEAIYIDGELAKKGGYQESSWEFFKEEIPDLNTFCVGRCSQDNSGYWHYSKMEAYTLRLYNRALTDDEVEKSYQNSLLLQK